MPSHYVRMSYSYSVKTASVTVLSILFHEQLGHQHVNAIVFFSIVSVTELTEAPRLFCYVLHVIETFFPPL